MNWKEKAVIRILMVVAKLLSPIEWATEINSLSAHLSVNLPDKKDGE